MTTAPAKHTDTKTSPADAEAAGSAEQRLAEVERALAELSAEVTRIASPEGESQQRKRLEHALRVAEQQQAELDAQRLRLRSQRRRVAATLKQRRAELQRQLEEFHVALATHGTSQPAATTAAGDEAVAELTRERDELLARLAAAEEAAKAAPAADKNAEDKMYEMQRRFEMAVEDMRAYKHRVTELEEQLAQRPAETEKCVVTGAPLDWAGQKARMLASLETDMAGADQQNDRLTVEGAVRITDEVVAEKEREIERLKQQMEDLRAERIAATTHDAGVAEVLDKDALIAAERERLRKLQESMLEKQRNAEVELAVERAKVARQRTEIEDRLHVMESDLAKRPQTATDAPATTAKPARGRWLARLGLKDEN